ncbi:hypothetical protein A7A08_02939 [Methyloligella halotolerans]|uniref:Uncharacterized protein n=1 Tax=Methyloligella halotolerans TaxID=1177755 RepID=A0A1E2RV15_9HYPH|nr:hypothetical protein A7A08_02939 [Methyloligella halotolerans]
MIVAPVWISTLCDVTDEEATNAIATPPVPFTVAPLATVMSVLLALLLV